MNKAQIERLVEETRIKAEKMLKIDITKLPIKFDLKGTTAGRVNLNKYYKFNIYIAENNPGFEQTVVHEVAHQASYQKFGRKGAGHGKFWQYTMRLLGATPNRCHDYKDVKYAKNLKRYKISCQCGRDLIMSSIRYNRQVKGINRYSCAKCGAYVNIKSATLIKSA